MHVFTLTNKNTGVITMLAFIMRQSISLLVKQLNQRAALCNDVIDVFPACHNHLNRGEKMQGNPFIIIAIIIVIISRKFNFPISLQSFSKLASGDWPPGSSGSWAASLEQQGHLREEIHMWATEWSSPLRQMLGERMDLYNWPLTEEETVKYHSLYDVTLHWLPFIHATLFTPSAPKYSI